MTYFEQGQAAFYKGLTAAHNPYTSGTAKEEWYKGWLYEAGPYDIEEKHNLDMSKLRYSSGRRKATKWGGILGMGLAALFGVKYWDD